MFSTRSLHTVSAPDLHAHRRKLHIRTSTNRQPKPMATTSSGDIFRYYNNEYQIVSTPPYQPQPSQRSFSSQAVNLHRECKLEAAEQKCRELEFNFECPRLIQVQACQLGSRCTSDYWRRKEHLEHGMFLLRQMDSRDQVVINSRQHTVSGTFWHGTCSGADSCLEGINDCGP